jgi:hypothetical protein
LSLAFLGAVVASGVVPPSLAGVPANDDFAARARLEGAFGQAFASNDGATRQPGEPRHAGEDGQTSIWWTWTPNASGRATVYTVGSGLDTLLAVYTGQSLPTLAPVAANDDDELSLTSLVTFDAVAGTAYQIAVDGFEGEVGPVVLTHHLDPPGAPPANDLFAAREPLVAPRVVASSRNARREAGEPDHAGQPASHSLWWTWTAPERGTATFHTNGSSFDTLLAVYVGATFRDLQPVAGDDDGGEGLGSNVVLEVEAGREYQLAVDGLDGGSGVVLLGWRFDPPCSGPPAPARPRPADGASGIALAPTLEWNVPLGQRKVIYGNDDRKDVYEVTDPALLKAWDSTVLVVLANDLTDNGDGTFTLRSIRFDADYPLCPGEPFADQPVAGFCSGFLVGPDLVASAGHCITGPAECSLTAFVFGYRMKGPQEPVLTFPAADVYRCREIVSGRVPDGNADFVDWTVVRLDRPVAGHDPLSLRRTGKVPDSQSVLVIGHPVGLPAKIAGGAFVRENADPGFFRANLDTYVGNSGSVVLNAATLVVEGLLVSGEEDFEGEQCLRSLRCPNSGCAGEVVARATEFEHVVPANPDTARHEVRFGPCGGLQPLGETEGNSWPLAALEPGTTYCWQVVARDECGAAEGPVWSFRTAGDAQFRRGDARDDGTRNLTDAITILGFLFLGQPEPGCLDSADADDNSLLNLTDAVYLLQHLFQSGPPPGEPLDCGSDPTMDGIRCRSYAACP